MKYWTRKKIAGGSAPKPIARVGVDLLAAIEGHGAEWPKLLRVGRHDSRDDPHRYEVEVELAPGLILPMEYGVTEDIGGEWNDTAHDEEDVVTWTMEGVDACLPDLDRLADYVHESRRRARAIVAGWREQGLPARVVDVHLAPHDHWRGGKRPFVRVLLETLDDRLEPVVERLEDWTERDLEATLAEARFGLSARTELRDALMRQGATGTINQLALNAINHFGDVAKTLRRFRAEWRFWLPDHTCILMRDGKADAGNGVGDDIFQWQPEGVSVSTAVELRRDLATAVGRPVTELVEHPFLSPDMSVLKTEWSVDNAGERWLNIELAMPWRLFCSTTGRVWDAGDADRGTGNVVPFGRKRA